MNALAQLLPRLSVENYLEGETKSEIRHEYIAGEVYAMSGESAAHNLIAGNLYAALRGHLRGGPCQVFTAGVKVRLRVAEEDIFYYPDVFVACRSDDRETYYRRYPSTIIEVLSESSERIDRREKFLAYKTIESLREYVIVAQNEARITLFRREEDWRPETFAASDTLALPSLDFRLPVREVYEGVL